MTRYDPLRLSQALSPERIVLSSRSGQGSMVTEYIHRCEAQFIGIQSTSQYKYLLYKIRARMPQANITALILPGFMIQDKPEERTEKIIKAKE